DRLVADMLEALPSGTSLMITADHGQVHVGDNIIHPSEELLRGVTVQSGEGRFRWLHTSPGAQMDVAQTATAEVGDTAWVVTKEQVIDEGWFGPTVAPLVRARLGDVALVARDDVTFHENADSGMYQLICRHGSLTSAEVNVPLVAATA
ncbi:MAG: alkaline phosphatase family protein, partial [Ilumatobacter sp.]|nr:alkaline phosphatase family protein [Ilumatobacter sp.]